MNLFGDILDILDLKPLEEKRPLGETCEEIEITTKEIGTALHSMVEKKILKIYPDAVIESSIDLMNGDKGRIDCLIPSIKKIVEIKTIDMLKNKKLPREDDVIQVQKYFKNMKKKSPGKYETYDIWYVDRSSGTIKVFKKELIEG